MVGFALMVTGVLRTEAFSSQSKYRAGYRLQPLVGTERLHADTDSLGTILLLDSRTHLLSGMLGNSVGYLMP